MRHAGSLVKWVRSPSLAQLARLYRDSSVFLFPSVCEGFGIPLLEAMYCGKPVVASAIPTSLEVAHDAAYFFQLGDEDAFYHAVNSALVQSGWEEKRRAAEERLRHYSWENLVKKYAETYQALVG